jgi:hypothetical protein
MQKSEQKAIQFCQYFSHFALPSPRLLRFLVQNLKGNKLVVPNKTNELSWITKGHASNNYIIAMKKHLLSNTITFISPKLVHSFLFYGTECATIWITSFGKGGRRFCVFRFFFVTLRAEK